MNHKPIVIPKDKRPIQTWWMPDGSPAPKKGAKGAIPRKAYY